MPEIPDVATGGIIASEWGNQVRSRTVQRYADAAARTSQHPTPAQGDLSFLANTGHVEVFGPGGWGPIAAGFEIDDDNRVDGSLSLTTSFANAASVSLSIPTDWASWKCAAWGRLRHSTIDGGTLETRIVIDGTAGQVDSAPANISPATLTVGARRTGITTTGSRTVALQVRRVGGSGGSVSLRYLYARAVRVT